MSFGGRGRGRGRGGGFRTFQHSKEEPFVLFPADVVLPNRESVTLDEDFFRWNNKLQKYYEHSIYFVEDSASQDCQSHDIERYSDTLKPSNKRKQESLSDYMKLELGYFPRELVKGVRPVKRKKVNWNPAVEDKKFKLFEALEKKNKDKDEDENEEDDDENGVEEEDEEFSDDGDYGRNEDFDDDDDDYNDNDDGDDEPFY